VRLGLYLSRVLALRILAAAAVLVALGLSLDLIRSADALIVEGGAGALAHYALLRAPAMAAQVLPLSVLVGGVTGFLGLGGRAELTVMRAAGQSVFRILARLLPLAAVLGLGHHLLIDRGIPWSERALGEAYGEIAEVRTPEEGARVAGRIGGAVVIGRLASRDGATLAPLTVYALDDAGQVTGRIDAAGARFRGDHWQLSGVHRVGETPGSETLERIWATALAPATVLAMAGSEAAATSGEAAAALEGLAVATRSTGYYLTRIAKSHVAFVVPAIMLLLAAFASFKGPRGAAGLGMAVTGTVLGLGFVMLDGIFGSLGQTGILGPAVAAWTPAALFAIAGAWLLLLNEG
jgi:lipopolysaccharide export system permease protein